MHPYAHKAGSVTGANRQLARLATVLGSDKPVAEGQQPSSTSEFLREVKATAPPDVGDGVGTILGAAGVAVLWKKHRLLGAIEGASLGRNLPALLHPELRPIALRNLGQTATAVAGSLLLQGKNSDYGSGWGFLIGWIAAGLTFAWRDYEWRDYE